MAGLTVRLIATLASVVPLDARGMHAHTAAMAADPTLWYFTRAFAAASYVMLTLAVLLGMLRSIARQSRERISWMVEEAHAVISTLAWLLVLGHLVTLLLDPFLPFTWSNLLLPLGEPYKPDAVRFGVFALYGMGLVLLTSWIRRRIAYRLWRRVHYLSLLAFVCVTAHGILAGSDTGEPWAHAMYVGAGASVVFMAAMRLFAGKTAPAEALQR